MAKKSKSKTPLLQSERIERAILSIRGQNVMIDADLAALYEVETEQAGDPGQYRDHARVRPTPPTVGDPCGPGAAAGCTGKEVR